MAPSRAGTDVQAAERAIQAGATLAPAARTPGPAETPVADTTQHSPSSQAAPADTAGSTPAAVPAHQEQAQQAPVAPAAEPALPPMVELPAPGTVDVYRDALDPASGGAAPQARGDEPGDIWERVRTGFRMQPAAGNGLVARHEAEFTGQQEYFGRIIERSRRYLFFILSEVEKRGMPAEIALLPMVESAFNPHALSRSHASGIWQFMPATGKTYGMSQNWWYDDRRDIVAATNGALDYLAKLYGQFGSWELALAAYNCGENKVARLLAQYGGDYWTLPLPLQTRNYVPKLLAFRNIVQNPQRYGLTLAPVANQPYFAAVTTTRHIDLKLAATFAEIPQDDFLALNPAFNRPVIAAHGERTILVPAETAAIFTARLHDPDAKLVSWRTHKLRRGESLDKVAGAFGLSGAELKRVNGISIGKTVAGGGTILVPARGADTTANLQLDAGRPEADVPSPPPPVVHHRVARGETLAGIARHYGVSLAQLRAWNRIGARSRVGVGKTLVVRRGSGEPFAATAAARADDDAGDGPQRYTVRRGDTLYSIARRFNIPVAELRRCNKLDDRAGVTAGHILSLRD